MKYPLKQQKAHSLVLTQIIQPGTRSKETERGVPLPPPPHPSSSGTVRLHVSYFTPPETRCNFPSPFQQSLVNTVCGETQASPALPPKPGRSREAGARGGRWPHTLPGLGRGHPRTKAETSGRVCCSRCCSPGTANAPPGGVGVATESPAAAPRPFCCAGAGGCAGRARASPGGRFCRGPPCEGPRIRRTGHGGGETAPRGLRRHRSNLGERKVRGPPGPVQVPPRNRRRRRAETAQRRPPPGSAESQLVRLPAHAQWRGRQDGARPGVGGPGVRSGTCAPRNSRREF